MATEIVLPDQKTDEVKEKVDEGGKAVDLESVSPSKENSEVDEEQNLKTAASSGPEVPVIKAKENIEEKQTDPPAVIAAEKDDDTHGLNVPAVDVPKETEALNLKLDVSSISSAVVEVAEKEPEKQSTLSDTLESTLEAGEKLIEHLEVPLTQGSATEEGKNPEVSESESKIVEKSEPTEKEPEVVGKEPRVSELESVTVEKSKAAAAEQSEVGKEAEEGTKTDLEVEGKPQKLTEVLEDVESKTALEVEEKPQEQIDILEEVEKIPALEVEDKTQKQTGVLEGEVEKKLTSEVDGTPQEQTEILEEEVGKKLILEVDETPQEQTGVLEGDVEKQLNSEVKAKVTVTPQEQTEVIEGEVEKKLISKVNETPQEQTGILEREVENKLTSEAEATLGEQTEVIEGEVKKSASKVEGEPQEQTEVLKKEAEKKLEVEAEVKPLQTGVLEEVEKNSKMPKSEESTDVGTAKGEATLVDKIEVVSESLKEEETANLEEPVKSEKLDAADVRMNEEAPSDRKDVLPAVVTDIEENTKVDDTQKEQSRDDAVEGLSKEAVVEVGKVEEEKNVADENALKVEAQNSVDGNDMSSAAEVAKECLEGGKASEDVGVAAEEKKEEDVKGDTDTIKEGDLEGKFDPIHDIDTVKEPAEVAEELEPENLEEPVEDKLNKEAEPVEQTATSDASNLEPFKDVSDLKTDEAASKQEAPTKPAQKQSNNLISKVKHSIVKVKKAIIGKSPSSKTLSTDTKGDINVK